MQVSNFDYVFYIRNTIIINRAGLRYDQRVKPHNASKSEGGGGVIKVEDLCLLIRHILVHFE